MKRIIVCDKAETATEKYRRSERDADLIAVQQGESVEIIKDRTGSCGIVSKNEFSKRCMAV